MKHYEMCTGTSCIGLERRGALLPRSTDIKELCTLMRGTPFCTDFMINSLRWICESLHGGLGMSLCITGLSTQDPHNQMEYTEFYEKCYRTVKDIEKNLSQKNYVETENYKLGNLKQKDSRVEKIKIISFLSCFNSHQIPLTFLRFQAVHQLHWSVLSHRQTYIAQCKCDKITICRFVSDNV